MHDPGSESDAHERTLERVVRSTPAALLAFGADGATVLVSPAARAVLGRDPVDLRGLIDLLRSRGADESRVVEVVDALRRDRSFSVRLDLPAAGIRAVLDVEQVPATGTSPALTVVSILDVTSVDRQAEVRGDLLDIMELAPFGVLLLSPVEAAGRVIDFEVAYVNRMLERAHGHSVTLGSRLDQLTGPLGRISFARYRAAWESKEADATTTRFEGDGVDEWFDVRVVPMPSALLVSLEAATERKRAVERLRENEELLKSSQSVANLGSFEWYVGRDELRWTEQMYDVVQVAPETFAHTYAGFLELLHPDDRELVDDQLRESIGHGTPYSGDMRRLMDDGRVIVLHSEARMVYERGQVPRFVGTLQDVTRARELEEVIRRTQRVESLGQMAAGVAHDFNNILTLVTMHAHLLRDQLEEAGTPAEALEDLAGIEDAVGRATNLTRQLLAFTGQQVRRPTVLDLGSVVTGVLPMLTRLSGEDVRIDVYAPPGVSVRADRTQVEQIVLNLVLNARDAVQDSGTVGIRVAEVRGDDPALRNAGGPAPVGSRWALIEVTDDGHGMSEHVRERALDPFFTTKPQGKGTGLGLSVVFGIVQQSGGRFAIDTEVGRGTTMSVALPLEHDGATSEAAPPVAPTAGGHESVLVVEDDAGVRELAARTLRDYGYDVVHAEDGEEALAFLDARPGIAAVVSDVAMPRMGGIELHRAIRQRHPEVAVLLMSGYTRPEDLPDDHRTAFVPKPLTGEGLSTALRGVLDS